MGFARMGIVSGLFCALALGAGCQNKVHDENVALHRQNRELQAKLSEANSSPKQDSAQLASLQQQIAERDAKLAELQNQLRTPATGAAADPSLAGIETSYDKSTGKMTVAVPGDVLFAPGDASIRDQAKSTLDKVAGSLTKDYAGKLVRIEGHTDKDPIKVSRWKSNQELSEARAAAVKNYLVKKGVQPSLISVVGYGSDKPKNPKDKALNRRVDIVVAVR
jgi:chemotaxis protein MotB